MSQPKSSVRRKDAEKPLSEYSLEELQAYFTIRQQHPVEFLEVAYGAEFWEMQAAIIESVRDNEYTSVKSCHGIGKSFTSAHVVHWFINAFPHSVVLTTAPTARQVEDILWKEINVAYERASEISEVFGTMLNIRYNMASDWFAVGLSTDDPNRFQGYHADYILIIVDESSGVKQEIFEAIEGVASTGHVRILELGNPTDPSGHFAGTFASPFYKNFTISCFDTPNFAPFRVLDEAGNLDVEASCDLLQVSAKEERDRAIVRPSLISPNWVHKALFDWGRDTPMFEARCLGRFPKISNDTLIPLQWALDAVDRKIEWDGSLKDIRVGVDVARYGFDKTIFATMHGMTLQPMEKYPKTATTETSGMIGQLYRKNTFLKIRVDDSGVGGGVTDECAANDIPVMPINVGEGCDTDEDKKLYANKRAQYYWHLRGLFQRGEISIPNDADLIAQLTSMKYRFTPKQQIIIESKEDMKKRLGISGSPDEADALMLACAPASDMSLADAFDAIGQDDERLKESYRPVTAGLRSKTF